MYSKETYLLAVKANDYKTNCAHVYRNEFDDKQLDVVEISRKHFEEMEKILEQKHQFFIKLHVEDDFNKETQDITSVKMVEYVFVLFVDDIVNFVK